MEPNKPKRKRKRGRPAQKMICCDLGKLAEKLPPKPIDMRNVLYWMDLGATQEEVAGAHWVSVDVLSKKLVELTGLNWSELKEKVCGSAKIKLRDNQLLLSERNAIMGIWLGKIWLGQKDNPDMQIENKGQLSDIIKALKQKVKELESVEEGEIDEIPNNDSNPEDDLNLEGPIQIEHHP